MQPGFEADLICSFIVRVWSGSQRLAHRNLLVSLIMGAAAALTSSAHAITRAWDGGGATGSWHTPANWNPNGVPAAGDDVVINVPGFITVTFSSGVTAINTLSCSEHLELTAGTLNVASSTEIKGTLSLTNSTALFGGSGALIVKGTMIWTGGVLFGTGVATVDPGGVLSFPPSGINKELQRHLVNNGTIEWSSSNIFFWGGSLTNYSVVNLNTASDPMLALGGTDAINTFTNEGIVNKYGAGSMTFRPYQPQHTFLFHNNGEVHVYDGQLRLASGTHSGAFTAETVEPGNVSSLYLETGQHHLTKTSTISGPGNLSLGWQSGTVTVDGTVSTSGSLHLYGSVELNGTCEIGTTLFVFDCDLEVNSSPAFAPGANVDCTSSDIVVNVDELTFPGGNHVYVNVRGPGNFKIDGPTLWNFGTMSDSGKTVLGPAATFTTGQPMLLSRVLENHGLLLLQESVGDSSILFQAGSIVNHGTIEVEGGKLEAEYGPGSIQNYGTITKSTSDVFSFSDEHFGFPVFNDGDIIIDAGTLRVESGGTGNGLVSVKPGTKLLLTGDWETGTLMLDGTLQMNPLDHLKLNEHFNQSRTGILDITANQIHSFIEIDGGVTLAGTVNAEFTAPVTSAHTLTLLEFNGPSSGFFDDIDLFPGGYLLLDPQVVEWKLFKSGDVNGDNVVNIDDLIATILAWGSCDDYPCIEDIHPHGGDDSVDVDDLLEVIGSWQ